MRKASKQPSPLNNIAFALSERKSTDCIFAEEHPDRGGTTYRINRQTIILIPHGANREQYIAGYIKRKEQHDKLI